MHSFRHATFSSIQRTLDWPHKSSNSGRYVNRCSTTERHLQLKITDPFMNRTFVLILLVCSISWQHCGPRDTREILLENGSRLSWCRNTFTRFARSLCRQHPQQLYGDVCEGVLPEWPISSSRENLQSRFRNVWSSPQRETFA